MPFFDITWEESNLREYLNNEFFYSFSYEERQRILLSHVCNPSNEWFSTRGGNNTTDYIFLLSISEVVRYFGDSGLLDNPNPPVYGMRQWLLSDEYNPARIANDINGEAVIWWLRSPGFDLDFTATVYRDGSINLDGRAANLDNIGIRPALLISLIP